MEEEQRKRFEAAVERKAKASEEASRHSSRNPVDDTGAGTEVQDSLISTATTQDAFDPRAKNTGKDKHTADKWNQ